jgi:hypothetical protein
MAFNVSELVNQLFAVQQLQPYQQVPYLLSLLDQATQHPAARVRVLMMIQAAWPQQVAPPAGVPQELKDWASQQTTQWLVESSDWWETTGQWTPDGSTLEVLLEAEAYAAIKELLQTAAPLEGYADGQLISGFVVPGVAGDTALYVGLFNGAFGPYLEAFGYPWDSGAPPWTSRPVLGTLDVPLVLPAGETTVQVRLVALSGAAAIPS